MELLLGILTIVWLVLRAALNELLGTTLFLALPCLVIYGFVTKQIFKALRALGGTSRWQAILGAIGIVLIPAAIFTYMVDADQSAQARTYRAGDRDNLVTPPAISTLAVVEVIEQPSREALCGDFCQRTLLNRVVDEIILLRLIKPLDSAVGQHRGMRFRLEEKDVCPPVDVKKVPRILPFNRKQRNWSDRNPWDLLQIEAAKGNCLVSSPVPVEQADAIIFFGDIKRGKTLSEAGLDIYADTLSASRFSFSRRTGDRYEEVVRSTSTSYYRVLPVALPGEPDSGTPQMTPQWLRTKVEEGSERTGDVPFDPLEFAQQRLGFDLSLHDADADDELRKVILDFIERRREYDPGSADGLEVYFAGVERSGLIPDQDVELIGRILADGRLVLPAIAVIPRGHLMERHHGKAEEIARSLFMRLNAALADQEQSNPRSLNARRISVTSKIIGVLPETAVLPYFDTLAELAGTLSLASSGADAVKQLSAFGDRAVPLLIELIDDAESARVNAITYAQKDSWQQPYVSALLALCRAGPRAKSAIPWMKMRMNEGEFNRAGRYGTLLLRTMSRLEGVTESVISAKGRAARIATLCDAGF